MMKWFYVILVFLALNSVLSQNKNEVAVKFFFNNGITSDNKGLLSAKVYGASLTDDRFGNSNSAYFLHGNLGSYINLGTTKELKPKSGSLSLWVKIDHPMPNGRGTETNPIILTHVSSDDDFNEAFIIVYDLNTKNVAANNTLNKEKQVSIYSSTLFSLREWHHLVLTYDYNFICFYIDGALEGKMVKKFDSQFLEGDSVVIGNLITKKNTRFLNGSVDDIEIFNRVLSQKEVFELYNAPNPNKTNILLNGIFISLAIIIFILIIIYAVKQRVYSILKKEKEKNELLHKSFEQEIKMLKAQMDPHFIFNSLNTILQFIITNENGKAELYLTKFSKLIRKLLESNTKDNISLYDELDIISKYLDIESIRFDKVFKPIINIEEGIDPYETFIPHMLIQPFIENAIWHGLRMKEGEKRLEISFEIINEKCLLCVIEDNGIGRNKAKTESHFKKESSLAINFIRQRLELMSKIDEIQYSLKIIDKLDSGGESNGTRIELILPIIKK